MDLRSWAFLVGTGVMCGAAVATPDALGRAGAVIAAVCLAVAWTSRRSMLALHAVTEHMGLLPQTITFQGNDDGTVTALISRVNGEPVIVTIPETVAEQGRDAVAHYLMHELDIGDDVDVTIVGDDE